MVNAPMDVNSLMKKINPDDVSRNIISECMLRMIPKRCAFNGGYKMKFCPSFKRDSLKRKCELSAPANELLRENPIRFP